MDTCPICREYVFKSMTHRCQPLWHVHLMDYFEDGETRKVYARDAQEAAAKCAERHDARSGEYSIVNSGEVDAVVWDKDMANPVRFAIEAHSEPVYNARPSRESIPNELIAAVEMEATNAD